MKETVRVSFDVPVEEHIFLKSMCVKARIPFRNLMKKVFHNTVEEFKKEKLQKILKKGLQEVKEGKVSPLTKNDLKRWNQMVRNA
jgi:hypothetical protein